MPGSCTALATSGRVVPDSASVAHAAPNALLTATANVVAPACDVPPSARCLASDDYISGVFTQSIIPVASHTRNVAMVINNCGVTGTEKIVVPALRTSDDNPDMPNNTGTHNGIMPGQSGYSGAGTKSSCKTVATSYSGAVSVPVLIPVRSHRIIMKRKKYS